MPYGPDGIRFLELHEARAHAGATRRVADLGDAILLHDPLEADPFMNRLSGLRLPADRSAFDRRLAELRALFHGLGRAPHLLLSPAFHTPPDLAERLAADGFVDLGATYLMAQSSADLPPPGEWEAVRRPGRTVERLTTAHGERLELLVGAAGIMAEAFAAGAEAASSIAAELDRDQTPQMDVVLVRVDGEPVSAGRRYTADGATYLSSIATRPGWTGRGYGSLVTWILADDGRRAESATIHLGVEWRNQRARQMYERLGFAVVGGRAAHLQLR